MLLSVVDLSSVLLFAVTFLTLYVVYRSRSNRKYPPSMPWLPVVGSLPFIRKGFNTLPRHLMEKTATLGNVFAFYAGPEYTVVLNGREAIHEALVTKAADFADRTLSFVHTKYKLRESIGLINRPFGADFKKYQQQTLSILKEFGFGTSIMESRISAEVSHLVNFVTRQNGDAFDFHDILTSSVMNVMHAILFGSRRDTTDPKLIHLTDVLDKCFTIYPRQVNLFPILRFVPKYKKKLAAYISAFTQLNDATIRGIDETFSCDTGEDSFVKSFIQSGGSRAELAGIVRDLLIGGSETSTTTLLWSLILLANHPEVQDRLHKEIDSVVPKDRFPSLDDQSNLPYVKASIMEVMRCKTLLPLAVQHTTFCDTEVAGYFIQKHTLVLVNLYSAHMDARVWNDPGVFRPERFSDSDVIQRNSIIPFSLGKRSCLGEQLARQELFLFLTGLLQHFEIRPPAGQEAVDATERWLGTTFPMPFKVRLISRR